MEYVHDYLIIGGGMAADAAAKAIAEVERGANIGIVGDEASPPYQRPPLSKALWKGDKSPADIDLATAKTGASFHLGRRIVSLDRAAHVARDEQGDTYRYRRLLLATGATPRALGFDGGERLIDFRTLADYEALRRYAKPGAHIAVIGGGFIGSELAASLCGIGCKVTMLFPGRSIGTGRYPDGLCAYLDAYYREHGVELRAGIKVTGGRAVDGGVELELSEGGALCVDAVVAGIGVTPNTTLAEQVGQVELPSSLAVRAAVTSKVRVQVDHVLPVRVPLRQTLSIPIPDPIQVNAQLQTTVPVDLEVPVKQVLHVDQEYDLDTRVKTRVLGLPITLPIQGKVPLKLDVPVDLVIPVHQRLPLQLTLPATVRITEPLNARIDTVLQTQVPIHEALALPVTAPVEAVLTFPQRDVQAGLKLIDARLPLSALTLGPVSKAAGPASPASAAVPRSAP